MAADEVDIENLEIADELIAERNAFEPGETPEDMTPWQRPITAFIDKLNHRVGQFIALLLGEKRAEFFFKSSRFHNSPADSLIK